MSLAAVPDTPRSIQGEKVLADAEAQFADQAVVDEYMRTVSDGLALCRSRFRHNYPAPSRSGRMHFEGRTPGGYLLRRVVCEDCGCAVQVQRWRVEERRVGGRRELRVHPHRNTVEYQENELGEVYPLLGHGRIRAGDAQASIAAQAMENDPEAMQLAKEVLRDQRQRRAAKTTGAVR